MCIKKQQKTTKNNKKQQKTTKNNKKQQKQQNMSTYVTKIIRKTFLFFCFMK